MNTTTKVLALVALLFHLLSSIAIQEAPADRPPLTITDETEVWQVMQSLGKVNVNNVNKGIQHDINKGQQLVRKGFALNFKGKKAGKISPKLTCIACHTLEKEHPKVGVIDPQRRLEHADTMSLPFLPGAPFYGLVNRVAFFTNDYQNTFASKHRLALQVGHRDIRKAIQACNTLYARGRQLEPWEVESILAYLWTLELKMSDLKMPDSIVAIVQNAINTNQGNAKAVNLMRRYYPEVYPASLITPPAIDQRRKISPILNSYSNGRRIYERSCLYCHAGKRFSRYRLDRQQKTFKFLKKNFDFNSPYSIYDVLRYSPGTKGERSHAPHYTAQRMNEEQLQDLRFYITQKASLGNQADAYYKKF